MRPMRTDEVNEGSSPVSEQQVAAKGFRGDIDGLRAIAILLVVGFHVDLPQLEGGFVGVDVFFVISGFLISRNLMREVHRSGSVSLASFWARRIRRLVPALSAMIVATLVASYFVLSSPEWPDISAQGAASATYLSNFYFALEQGDYFGFELAQSPFLHTWSLSVEEQFYVFWPLMFLAVAALARRGGASFRQLAPWYVGAVTLLSFAGSVVLTPRSAQWAFFGSPTRAWEFGVGALLAMWAVRPTRGAALFLGIGGLLAVAVAGITFRSTTPYPGWAALLPVAGTVAVIAGGGGDNWRGTPFGVLNSAPLQWLGRLSYSWYLWHWPFIVLGVVVLGDDAIPAKVLLALLSLGVSYVGYRLIERPIRFATSLASNRRTILVGIAMTVATLVAAGALVAASDLDSDSPVIRQVTEAREDTFQDRGPECVAPEPEWEGVCELGDRDSATTVLLVGDSQAQQWAPAFDEVARQRGVRLLVSALGACPAHPVSVSFSTSVLQESPECTAQRRLTDALIEEAPDAVVVVDAAYDQKVLADDGGAASSEEQSQLWTESLESFVQAAQAAGASVGLVMDSPQLGDDPNTCVARAGSVDDCVPTRSEALESSEPYRDVESGVAERMGLAALDPVEWLCDDDSCALEIEGRLVYADQAHLTYTQVMNRQAEVRSLLDALLGGTGS